MVNYDEDIKSITLDVQRYVASSLMDAGFSVNVKAEVQYRAEYLGYLLSAMMKVPGQVLQDERVLASYPATFWQHVRKVLGLKYERVEVRLTEHLLYPTIEVPNKLGDKVRLYVKTSFPTFRG